MTIFEGIKQLGDPVKDADSRMEMTVFWSGDDGVIVESSEAVEHEVSQYGSRGSEWLHYCMEEPPGDGLWKWVGHAIGTETHTPDGHEYGIDYIGEWTRVDADAAARAAAMRELLDATAEWRSGTMGRSYHDSLEETVNRLLVAKEASNG